MTGPDVVVAARSGTTSRGAAGPATAPPSRHARPVDRGVERLLTVGVVLVVVLQRLAVPVGPDGISAMLPLGYVLLGLLLLRRAVEPDALRTVFFVVASGACAVMAWTAMWRSERPAMTSFLLLLAVYVPWLFRLRGVTPQHALAIRLGRVYVRLMCLSAVVAIGQLAGQVSGSWTFEDLLADVVPGQYLLGDYNTVTTIAYGSPTVKSQAFVFLEPSFLSQYLALAVVVAVLLRAPVWQPLLLAAGMVTTFSGTGIVLLVAGAVLIVLRSLRSLRPTLLATGALAVVVLLSTPWAAPLTDRSQEASESTSSWSLRFVLPYQEVAAGIAEVPRRYLTGAGPGTAERLLESDKQGAGLAVVYPVVPKLVFEYGLLAGLLFACFWLITLVRHPPWPVVPGCLVVMLGLLSGSLLQPTTAMFAWLFSAVLAHEMAPSRE